MTITSAQMFSGELLPDERIEWIGLPNPSIYFHPEDWSAIPLSLLWGGFAIVWFLAASGIWDILTTRPDRTFRWFGVIWGMPFVLIGQYFIWGRFVYDRWLKQQTYYALTNKRALILQNGFGGRFCSSASFENLPMIDQRVRNDGIGDISFGGPVTGKWRGRGKNSPPRPLTFDDLDNVETVYRIAIRINDQNRKT